MASSELPFLCEVQAVGLLYFNLASIMWTSCFAFTLYRDVVPSYRRQALRKYELSFHLLCWLLHPNPDPDANAHPNQVRALLPPALLAAAP